VADDVLGERFRTDLKAELRRQLEDIGVELRLSTALLDGPPSAPGELRTFTARTGPGGEVTADIWFRCYGVTPVSDYLSGSLAGARRPDGFVEITPYLQVAGQDRVFALGDVSTADHKMAGAATRQAQVVAGNIRALIDGKTELTSYQPAPPGIIVPIGPEGGSGQRPGSDDLVTPEVVAEAKGRDMMVERFAEMLGTAVPAAER
jgi:apoptosis-inducing factor 2